MTPAPPESPSPLASLEAHYLAAQSAQEYARVRSEALEVAATAAGADALHARVVVAECTYFGAIVKGGARPEPSRLATILRPIAPQLVRDLVDGGSLLHSGFEQERPEITARFVSLLSIAARISLPGDEARADDWRALAGAIGSHVPVDFTLPQTWGSDWLARSIGAAIGLATIAFAYGDADDGLARCRAALDQSLANNDLLADVKLLEGVYATAAACWAKRPELVPAIVQLHSVILAHFDHWRSKRRTRTGRLWVADQFEHLVARLQADMAEPLPLDGLRGDPAQLEPLFAYLRDHLFRDVEAAKSRLLLDRMMYRLMHGKDAFDAVPAVYRAYESGFALPPRADDSSGIEPRLLTQLRTGGTPDEIGALELIYARNGLGLEDPARVSDLDDIVAELEDDEALVEYVIPRETLHPARRIFILAVTKRGLRHTLVSLDVLREAGFSTDAGRLTVGEAEAIETSPLANLVSATRSAIQKGEDVLAATYLRLLDLLLVAPLEQMGLAPRGFRRWHIVPHGVLHAVPFAALRDREGVHLNDRVTLSHAPSASIWWMMRRRALQPPGLFVGVARPDLLPKTEDEVRAAASRLAPLPSELLVGAAATLAALAGAAPRCTVLHIASHGHFPTMNVTDEHGVVLMPGLADDGRLTAQRVRKMDLGGVGLVVLSVCNGGMIRFGSADEMQGLVPAFLETGVANVLTTLWEIDDGMTRAWMKSFYKALATEGPAVAAKRARALFIADGAAYRDWASFVLTGAGDPRSQAA